jgi:hypothetical protein
MTALPIPNLNLMPAARVQAGRRRKRVRAWLVAGCVYGLLLGGVWGYSAFRAAQAGDVGDELRALNDRIDLTKANLKTVEGKLLVAKREAEAAMEVRVHPDMSILLRLIAVHASKEITLERIDLRPAPVGSAKSDLAAPNGYVVRLSGLASSQNEVPRFARDLQDLGVFESISIVGIKSREAARRIESKNGEVQLPPLFSFEIEGTLSDKAAAEAGGQKR